MSEVGENIHRFSWAKAFAKWLGFTSNNKASGGKVLSRKTLKNKSNLPNTFRQVANSIGKMNRTAEAEGQSSGQLFSADGFQGWPDQGYYGDGSESSCASIQMLTTSEAYDPGKLVRNGSRYGSVLNHQLPGGIVGRIAKRNNVVVGSCATGGMSRDRQAFGLSLRRFG